MAIPPIPPGAPVSQKTIIGSKGSTVAGRVSAAAGLPARILMVGHSHTTGAGAGSGNYGMVNSIALGIAGLIPQELTKLGYPTKNYAMWGAGNAQVTVPQWDPRIALGTGWASNGAATLGGTSMIASAASSGTCDFTPGFQFSSAKVWYPRNTTLSTAVQLLVDGVLATTVNQQGAQTLLSATLGPGSVVSAKNTIAAAGYVLGIEAFPADGTPYVMSTAGIFGTTTSVINSVSFPWDSGNMIVALAPDVLVIYSAFNDIKSTPVATYQAQLEGLLAKGSATGTCLLVIDPPGSDATFTNGTYESYATAMYSSAQKYGASICDLRQVFSRTYAYANAQSLMFDASHYNIAGHQIAAKFIARELSYLL